VAGASFPEWETTCDTLHMWTQIVGKTLLALTPLENHWWNVTLHVTPCGLNTPPIPFGRQTFDIEFDFVAHKLMVRTSEGGEHAIPLYPRSVADFYREYMACLRSLGIEVTIRRTPVEFDDTTPFDQDQHHASYDTKYIESFRRRPGAFRSDSQAVPGALSRQMQPGTILLGFLRSGGDSLLRPPWLAAGGRRSAHARSLLP